MRVFIFGDANVDVTVKWQDVMDNLDSLSKQNQSLILDTIKKSRAISGDVETYLPKQDLEVSDFFNSLNPRVEFGGCGGIKARTMAMMGHDVVLYSWVGDDENGQMVLSELKKAGVDTSNVLVDGKTCETYNMFEPKEKRVAFSFWQVKGDLGSFSKEAKGADAVFLTGGHRIKIGLGYSIVPDAFVFTGSLAPYSKEEIVSKYNTDFSQGVLVSNDLEIQQLSGEQDVLEGLKKLSNDIIVMHGPHLTAVKRGNEIVTMPTAALDRSKIVELTGIGDVWEATFLGLVGDLKTVSEEKLKDSMKKASEASVHRMLTGEFPKGI
jgi:sugar/nucleoside kinase (ribokinase family)